jgi:histidine triad (HIT) family protein
MSEECVFCGIARGSEPAGIVWQDEMTVAFVDLRQFHPGHTLVIPRRHLRDIRDLDAATGAALMSLVVRIARALTAAFPNQGLSLWHSAGPAAFQEVPHLHIHLHPRLPDDALLRVYPSAPVLPELSERERYAAMLRSCLD